MRKKNGDVCAQLVGSVSKTEALLSCLIIFQHTLPIKKIIYIVVGMNDGDVV